MIFYDILWHRGATVILSSSYLNHSYGSYWMVIWLVVWNIFYFSRWDDDPIWRTHIFQMGRSTTNEIRWETIGISHDLTIHPLVNHPVIGVLAFNVGGRRLSSRSIPRTGEAAAITWYMTAPGLRSAELTGDVMAFFVGICVGMLICKPTIPSGKHTKSYWKWP